MTQKKPKSSLPTLWVAKASNREAFREHVLRDARNPTLQRLLEIVREKLEEADRRETTLSAYDNPAWAYSQAHNNGLRQGLQFVADLLHFIEKGDKQ